MASKITICNLALAQQGQEPISSLEQSDERARRLNLFYEPVKEEVLRTHNWGFACAEEALALIEKQDSRLPYVYQYPADALFIRRVFNPARAGSPEFSAAYPEGEFVEGFLKSANTRVLKTHIPGAYAQYTKNIMDASLFDAAFVKSFSLALAADIALALTGDASLAAQLLQKYTLSLDEARRANMTEGYTRPCASSAFVEVR